MYRAMVLYCCVTCYLQDTLATELLKFVSREGEYANWIIKVHLSKIGLTHVLITSHITDRKQLVNNNNNDDNCYYF